MGLFDLAGSVARGAVEVGEAIWQQKVSNDGFDAGLNGMPPRAYFGSPEYRSIYESAYKKGQDAAKARLLNALGKNLEGEPD